MRNRVMCLQLRTEAESDRLLWWTRTAEERGVELVEAAFVLPLLLALLLGIVWMGHAYNVYETITRAAREGARYAGAPTCATCGNTLPSSAQVQTVVNNALSAGSLDPSKVKNYSFQQGVTLNPGGDPPETGVVVSFGYPVQLAIPFTPLSATSITISTQVQMRRESQ